MEKDESGDKAVTALRLPPRLFACILTSEQYAYGATHANFPLRSYCIFRNTFYAKYI